MRKRFVTRVLFALWLVSFVLRYSGGVVRGSAAADEDERGSNSAVELAAETLAYKEGGEAAVSPRPPLLREQVDRLENVEKTLADEWKKIENALSELRTTLQSRAETMPWEHAPDRAFSRSLRAGAALAVFALCALIVWHITTKFLRYGLDLGAIYTIFVTGYVFSRFLFAALYRAPKDVGFEPTVAIIVPAYNEGEAVARTIHACLGLSYPAEKLEVVVINDGSTDDTWQHMLTAARSYPDGRVRCVDLGSNQGKRAAMAAGIRATTAEALVFVDSDSIPAPGAVRKLVQGFAHPQVGAISGLTYVRNADVNLLTRMQAARYYVSFQLLKAAESVVGGVSCCSGCFAAYRRTAVEPILARWENQRFLGVVCTYGDDRSLTNMVLREGWRTIYDAQAEAWTDVPHEYKKFFRQQLRWKKSWSREGPILASHLWRTRPLAFPGALSGAICGLLSPWIVAWNLIAQPLAFGRSPTFYILCVYLMSVIYALLYRALREDGIWKYAIAATFFYVAFSSQILWAIIRIRDGKWGTRDQAAEALPVTG